MLQIEPIAAFSDNYIWLLSDPASGQAVVVDPGDASPVLSTLSERGLTLSGIMITHHHFDHVGGLATLKASHSCHVWGPHNPGIDGVDTRLADGDSVEILGTKFDIIEVPGHTMDHIAFYHAAEKPLLFCGDTLFAGGCGRVFEGTFPMMHASLKKLAVLPEDTAVYCAHEYTLANLTFARAVEPDNQALADRIAAAEATRARSEATVPSTLGLELATNPFLRAETPALVAALSASSKLEGETGDEVFATVRGWKDNF